MALLSSFVSPIICITLLSSSYSLPFIRSSSYQHARFSIFRRKTSWRNSLPFYLTSKKDGTQAREKSSKTAIPDQTPPLRTLYPPCTPYKNGTLAVDSLHTLAYYEYGNPYSSLLTALYLHGGPGAGCYPNHARFFDARDYRIVLFDQRGCGRSTPRGEIRGNELRDLVADCETLRRHLNVSKWDVVVGGSFGVALAVAYAQTYPENVGALVLRGVCLMRPEEVDWLVGDYGGAGQRWNRNGWDMFSSLVVDQEPKKGIMGTDSYGRRVLQGYHNLLLGDDHVMRFKAAQYWFGWEMSMMSLLRTGSIHFLPLIMDGIHDSSQSHSNTFITWDGSEWMFRALNQTSKTAKYVVNGVETTITAKEAAHSLRQFSNQTNLLFSIDNNFFQSSHQTYNPTNPPNNANTTTSFNITQAASFIPAQSMLTCHYSFHNGFMTDYSLLDKQRVQKIRHIPCIAIQGCLDLICPPDTVLDLHRVWPEMQIRFVLQAGHSTYDPPILSEIVEATDYFRNSMYEKEYRRESC